MSNLQTIVFEESLIETRAEAGQCAFCGSDKDTVENPLEEFVINTLKHRNCTIISYNREAVI